MPGEGHHGRRPQAAAAVLELEDLDPQLEDASRHGAADGPGLDVPHEPALRLDGQVQLSVLGPRSGELDLAPEGVAVARTPVDPVVDGPARRDVDEPVEL